MPVIKHTHKYILRPTNNKGDKKLYFCALPDCSHFMPWLKGVLNKSSICWECEEEFLITQDIITPRESGYGIVKPRCLKCRGKVMDDSFDKILDGIL